MPYLLLLSLAALAWPGEAGPALPLAAGPRSLLAVAVLAAAVAGQAAAAGWAVQRWRAGGGLAALRALAGRQRLHAGLGLGLAAFLFAGCDWAGLVRQTWGLDRYLLLGHLAVLVPVFLPAAGYWLALGEVRRAVLAETPAVSRGTAGRAAWFAQQAREHCGLWLPPLLLLLVVQDAVRQFLPAGTGPLGGLLAAVALAGLVAAYPEFVRRVVRAEPLPDRPLAARLRQAARARGVAVRDILYWPTGGRLANAAVAGVFGRWRYVFLTDRLLAVLAVEEVEAVLAHELAHAQRRHLLARGLAVLAPVSGLAVLAAAEQFLTGQRRAWNLLCDPAGQAASWAVLAGWACFAWQVGGWYLRRTEQEADLAAVLGPAGEGPPDPLRCRRLAHGLWKLARGNGQSPRTRTWMHPAIGQRAAWLRRAAGDPRWAAAVAWRGRWLARFWWLSGGLGAAAGLWMLTN